MTEREWIARGYTPFMAEALEGQEHSPEAVALMSAAELFDSVLQWHGISGFTHSIAQAFLHANLLHGHNGEMEIEL